MKVNQILDKFASELENQKINFWETETDGEKCLSAFLFDECHGRLESRIAKKYGITESSLERLYRLEFCSDILEEINSRLKSFRLEYGEGGIFAIK
jgi:hypothetical protein